MCSSISLLLLVYTPYFVLQVCVGSILRACSVVQASGSAPHYPAKECPLLDDMQPAAHEHFIMQSCGGKHGEVERVSV